jgi:sugar/nucleoside kinase (ribokinase family)
MVDVDRPIYGLDELLRLADVVVSGEAYRGTPEDGQLWVTTLGPLGSVARVGDRQLRTAGFPITVRDTTGAGDVFRGAFAARWAEGEAVTLEALLEYANAAGALACRSLGAQGSLPTPDEVSRLLAHAAGRGKSL